MRSRKGQSIRYNNGKSIRARYGLYRFYVTYYNAKSHTYTERSMEFSNSTSLARAEQLARMQADKYANTNNLRVCYLHGLEIR